MTLQHWIRERLDNCHKIARLTEENRHLRQAHDGVLAKIEERALRDVADRAGAEDVEDMCYLAGRIRGLRLAASMLKDIFPGEALT